MKIVHTIQEVRSFIKQSVLAQKSIGFVPTMGALHKGHMSLVQACKNENDVTVMSIFVNPTQFGPKEDLASYFRPIEQDTAMARDYGVDLLFLPDDKTMYSDIESVRVTETKLNQVLCGKFRPGHFDGVCTIVSKLLHIVAPNRLYLGMKDAQQLRIVEKMTTELFFDVQVVPAQTIREDDGLACSSRNGYLASSEREIASTLYQALTLAQKAFQEGERNSDALVDIVRNHIEKQSEISIQYVELLEWRTFEKQENIQEKSLLALACYIGETRLIDNIILDS